MADQSEVNEMLSPIADQAAAGRVRVPSSRASHHAAIANERSGSAPGWRFTSVTIASTAVSRSARSAEPWGSS